MLKKLTLDKHSLQVEPGVDNPLLPTFVTVVEAGPLEKQVCLLLESLRRWGGRAANAPVFVIRPRRGPHLSRTTMSKLEELDAEYIHFERSDGMEWFPYLNKTAAVLNAAARCQTTSIAWLDADIIVMEEPIELLGVRSKELRACATDRNIGTADDEDEFAPYFKAACTSLGVDFDSLPYVTTETDKTTIRAYWNSGVYAFDTQSDLAEVHHRFTLSLVKNGVASRHSKLYFSDQISLGLAAHALNLRSQPVSQTHNFGLAPKTFLSRLSDRRDRICLLHYHDCLWAPHFGGFCDGLQQDFPDVAEWLRSKGPLEVGMTAPRRAYRKALKIYRDQKYRTALRGVHYY